MGNLDKVLPGIFALLVCASAGAETVTVYDQQGRAVRAVEADGRTMSYSYGENGRKDKAVDDMGQKEVFSLPENAMQSQSGKQQ